MHALKFQPPKIFMFIALLFLIEGLSSACLPATPVIPSTTPTVIQPTVTATPTIVWFPPTATFTPFPSPTPITPTPELRPGVGIVLLRDDFSSPDMWQTVIKDGGSAQPGKNEFSIAINRARVYVSSLRIEPQFYNFYAEITANPSLCRGMDEYGLLIRAASANDYYRFSLSCDGQVRLDRIYQGQASSPQPWLLSGAVPPGGPSTSRLGMWAVEDEMRFFVNGEFQFTVKDGLIPSGAIGIFARSASDQALTVNFSDLTIWEVIP